MLRGKYGVLNAYSVKDEMSKPITVVRKKKKKIKIKPMQVRRRNNKNKSRYQ